MPRERLAVTPAGVAAVLGSLRRRSWRSRTIWRRCFRISIEAAGKGGSTNVELRPRDSAGSSFESAAAAPRAASRAASTACTVSICGRADDGDLSSDSIIPHAAGVRRAEREGLTYEAGTSERLLASFYRLLRMTRRRHRLPPQPIAWFRNLLANLGDGISIHVASKDGEPIASMLTLSFKKTSYYKYGGSDAALHRLGGMPFLFWRVIHDARAGGFEELDLGRSDLDQPGLIAFKEHLGATSSTLTYYCYPARTPCCAPRLDVAPRARHGRLPARCGAGPGRQADLPASRLVIEPHHISTIHSWE